MGAAGPRSPRAVHTLGGLAQAAAGARAVADRGGLIRQAVPEHRRAAPQPCRALLRLQLPLRFPLRAPPGAVRGHVAGPRPMDVLLLLAWRRRARAPLERGGLFHSSQRPAAGPRRLLGG